MAKFKITGLPKAQIGGKPATSLLFSPYEQGMFSNSLHPVGSMEPSFILGAERSNLFPTWGYNNGVRSSLSGQVQIPYAMNQAPGVKGRWTTEYSPNAGKGPVQFTTTGQLEGGYNPDQGFNASMMAWPHIWGSNVDVSRWRNPQTYYPGAFRAGIGPQLGPSYMSKPMTTSGNNDIIEVGQQMTSNQGALHYGGRGYLEYTPTDWLKLRLDAQGMFDPLTNKIAEGTAPTSGEQTEHVNWKFSPGVQLTATVPIDNFLRKKKIEESNRRVQEMRNKKNKFTPMWEDGGITMDLTDAEIEQYKQGGYVVEELPQAQFGRSREKIRTRKVKSDKKKDPNQPVETATSIMSGTQPVTPNVVQPGTDAFDLNVGTVDHDPLLTAAWNRAVAYDNVMNKANELRTQNEKLSEDLWQKTLADRQAAFEKAGKFDKIDPLQSMQIYQFEERQKKDPNYLNSLKEQGYLVSVDKENGQVHLYPKNEIESRIKKNGLRTDDIVNKLGVGNKELIDTEFGDTMKSANEYHAWQTKQTLQDLMLDKGWSKEKAIDYLVNTKKLGTKEGLEKIYNTDFKDIDKSVRSYYAYGEDYKPPYLDEKGNMIKDLSLVDKWKDNDVITLARDRDFIDSYGAALFSFSPVEGSPEYQAQVLQKLRSGKWGWSPKTNTLIKLGADDAYKNLAMDPTEEDVNEISRIGDYRTLTNQQFNDKYYGDANTKLKNKEGYQAVQIANDPSYQATEWGYDDDGNYTRFDYMVNVPVTDPNTGEVTFKQVPSSTLRGKTIYMSDADAAAYRKASVGNNTYESWKHPGMYLPGVIGAGAFAPAVIPAVMNYAPISTLPGLTAGNALTGYFGYEALKPEGDFHQAYKDFKKGNIWGGLENSLWGTLGVTPLFKPAIGTFKALNDLKKPGGMGLIPTRSNLHYSISGQRGAAGKTGLDASHIDEVRSKAIARLQSDDYLKKRMANTGETEEQVRADVNKIISEAKDARYNLNAYINAEGQQTPKGLQNLWRYPTVDISRTAENPITTLIHENNHLYSPAGYSQHLGRMVEGRGNPNIASVPFGKKRGVYANYPQLGVTDDIGEYEAREWEQQVRHLNARDQIISANNLAEDAKVTPEMVEKFGQDWFKRMRTEGAVAEDYDAIWHSELKNVRETLAKEKGFANTAELEKNLTEADKAAFLKEVRKRWSEKVADVLNSAWMGVPAVIGAGALGAGATDGEFKKGGFPKNIGKLKKFIR